MNYVTSYRDLEVYKLARELSQEILTDADGEQQETQHWLETALDCAYISEEITDKLVAQYAKLGKMLGAMMAKSSIFCRKI